MSGNFSIDYGLGLYGLLVPMEHPYKFSTMWFSQCLVYLRSSYLLPSYLRSLLLARGCTTTNDNSSRRAGALKGGSANTISVVIRARGRTSAVELVPGRDLLFLRLHSHCAQPYPVHRARD